MNFVKDYFDRMKKIPVWMMGCVFVCAYIAHGAMLFSQVIGIDTENSILDHDGYAVQGRQGILWLRSILRMSDFNLYLTEAITFFLLILAAVVFYIFYHTLTNKENYWDFIPFSVMFIVSPFWTCQVYFLSQSVPVLVAVILVPVTFSIFESAFKTKKLIPLKILIGVALLQLIIGTYQVNLVVYTMFVCTVFILTERNKIGEGNGLLKRIGFHALCAVLGLAVYIVISKLFYLPADGQAYLTGQIMYSKISAKEVLGNLIRTVARPLGFDMYGYLYWPVSIVTFVLCIVGSAKRKMFKKEVGSVILVAALVALPFVFPFFYGCEVSPRMRYVFPIAEASLFFIGYSEITKLFRYAEPGKKTKAVKVVSGVLFVLIFFLDTMKGFNYTTRLNYTNDYIYWKEKEIATTLKKDLDEYYVSTGNYWDGWDRIVFLGAPNPTYNQTCLPGYAVIGSPILNWDIDQYPRTRIYNFLEVTGNSIGSVPWVSDYSRYILSNRFEELFGEEVDAMPAYPWDGYIKEVYDEEAGARYTVVKLGYNWRDSLPNQ